MSFSLWTKGFDGSGRLAPTLPSLNPPDGARLGSAWRPHCLDVTGGRHTSPKLRTSPPSCSLSHSMFSMRRLNVLVVEDDDDERALYGYMLAAAGYGAGRKQRP